MTFFYFVFLTQCHCYNTHNKTDKPKFSKSITTIELNEYDSAHLSLNVYSNPAVEKVVFNRLQKAISSKGANLENVFVNEEEYANVLGNLIDGMSNPSWLLVPVPSHWSWNVVSNVIFVNIHNATISDDGLYVARVSNTLGTSSLAIRLSIKSEFILIIWLRMCRYYFKQYQCYHIMFALLLVFHLAEASSIVSIELHQPNKVVSEGDTYFRVICNVLSNDSITLKWSRQSYYQNILSKTSIKSIRRHKSHFSSFRPSSPTSSSSNNRISYKNDELDPIDWSRTNVSHFSSILNNSAVTSGLKNYHGKQLLTSQLTISNVTFEDSGIYTCAGISTDQHISSKNIQISVRHAPHILTQPIRRKVAADVGVPFVKFVCSALAYPVVYFNWTVKGSVMVSSEVNRDDDKYQVVSHNTIASSTTTRSLRPKGSGTNFTTNDNDINMSSYYFESELIIRRVAKDDFRSYNCLAYNQMGKDQMTFELVKKSKLTSFSYAPLSIIILMTLLNSLSVSSQ